MEIFRAEEIWFAAKTNTSFPKLDGIQHWSWNWDSHWKEIWKPVETNTIQHFPKLDGLSLPTSSVFGRFQTLCEEKNTQKPIQQWVYMYGRANQSFPTCLVPNKSLYLSSTFSASPHRGLRHSSQYQTARSKKLFWYWDEVPCLGDGGAEEGQEERGQHQLGDSRFLGESNGMSQRLDSGGSWDRTQLQRNCRGRNQGRHPWLLLERLLQLEELVVQPGDEPREVREQAERELSVDLCGRSREWSHPHTFHTQVPFSKHFIF